MRMFDHDDYEDMVNSTSKVPDGIIDGTQYAKIFDTLNTMLENVKPGEYHSNILWVMNCINECYPDSEHGEKVEFDKSRAADVVTSLAYFSMTMLAALDELGVRNEYFDHQKNTVIPQLFSECESIPWYDFTSQIKEAQDLSDEFNSLMKSMEDDDK